MRILVALPPFEVFSPLSGGAVSTVAEGLGRAWAAAGHEVSVTTPDAPTLHRTVEPVVIDFPRHHGAWARRLESKVEGRLREFDWPGYRLYVEELKRVVRARRPDCLIVHNDLVLPTLRLPLPASRIVVHLHNQVNVLRPDRAAEALRAVHGTVAVSDFIRADARSRFSSPAVATIRNGVDVAAFRRPRVPRAPGAPLRVAFVGRLLLAKGAHVLLDAAEELASSGTALQVTVMGSPTFDPTDDHTADPYVDEVRTRVQRLGARYLPHQGRTAVADELAGQDVVVVPSIFPDPCPLVMLEAMAAGCAVVGSDIGGIPETVAGAGLLYPPGDSHALAEVLRTLSEDEGALTDHAERGRRRAEGRDWAQVAEEWTPVLGSL